MALRKHWSRHDRCCWGRTGFQQLGGGAGRAGTCSAPPAPGRPGSNSKTACLKTDQVDGAFLGFQNVRPQDRKAAVTAESLSRLVAIWLLQRLSRPDRRWDQDRKICPRPPRRAGAEFDRPATDAKQLAGKPRGRRPIVIRAPALLLDVRRNGNRNDARQLLALRQRRLLVSLLHREPLCPVLRPHHATPKVSRQRKSVSSKHDED